MSREAFFVCLSVTASIVSCSIYLLSIYRKETNPHVFSWLNWGLMIAIGAYAQFRLHGGLSAWGLAFMATTYVAIAFLGLFVGEKNISRSDWLTFSGALLALILWQLTNNPIIVITLLMAFDVLSYWPTVRKSWLFPWGEPPKSYFWTGLRYFFLLFTIPHPTVSILIYPFWLMTTDWTFMLYIIARRRILKKPLAISL